MSATILLAYNPSDVKPGWIAFFIVLALVVATFFLWRNMNKQLGRIKAPHQADLPDEAPPGRGPRPTATPSTGPPSTETPSTATPSTGTSSTEARSTDAPDPKDQEPPPTA